MPNKIIRVVAHYAAYTLSTRIAPPPFFNYNAFDCEATLRDKKVNIQASCGGTRDPYFMRFQHSPLFSAGYTFCITAFSLPFFSLPLSLLLCHTVEKICMFHMSNGGAAVLFYRPVARFESVLKAARRNMV